MNSRPSVVYRPAMRYGDPGRGVTSAPNGYQFRGNFNIAAARRENAIRGREWWEGCTWATSAVLVISTIVGLVIILYALFVPATVVSITSKYPARPASFALPAIVPTTIATTTIVGGGGGGGGGIEEKIVIEPWYAQNIPDAEVACNVLVPNQCITRWARAGAIQLPAGLTEEFRFRGTSCSARCERTTAFGLSGSCVCTTTPRA
ncbi:MAG: hypothetical protein WC763_06240 [Candidatus Paceibacterota bacterium]